MRTALCSAIVGLALCSNAQTNDFSGTNFLSRPLSRHDAVEIAMGQNSTVLRGRADLRATHGVQMQLRSAAMPRVVVNGFYNAKDPKLANEPFLTSTNSFQFPNQAWQADGQVQQPLYAGGRIASSWRSARL